MAVLKKEDFLNRLKAQIGEDTSDEALSFLEDMTDTFNDMETRSTGKGDAEWQKKYDDLDKSWRDKYTARFFSTEASGSPTEEHDGHSEEPPAEETTFEDLFTESEG